MGEPPTGGPGIVPSAPDSPSGVRDEQPAVAPAGATAGDDTDEQARASGLVTVPWHPDGSGPVPTADGPVEHRWRKIIGRTLGKAWGDSLFGLSPRFPLRGGPFRAENGGPAAC